MTQMYGPAVRCKRTFIELADVRSCINVSGLCLEPFVLPAIMDISARAISLADRPQWAIWVTSVRMRREDRSSISFDPLADLGGLGLSGYIIVDSLGGYLTDLRRLEVPAVSQNAPGDAGQFVGERNRQHVVV